MKGEAAVTHLAEPSHHGAAFCLQKDTYNILWDAQTLQRSDAHAQTVLEGIFGSCKNPLEI